MIQNLRHCVSIDCIRLRYRINHYIIKLTCNFTAPESELRRRVVTLSGPLTPNNTRCFPSSLKNEHMMASWSKLNGPVPCLGPSHGELERTKAKYLRLVSIETVVKITVVTWPVLTSWLTVRRHPRGFRCPCQHRQDGHFRTNQHLLVESRVGY